MLFLSRKLQELGGWKAKSEGSSGTSGNIAGRKISIKSPVMCLLSIHHGRLYSLCSSPYGMLPLMKPQQVPTTSTIPPLTEERPNEPLLLSPTFLTKTSSSYILSSGPL